MTPPPPPLPATTQPRPSVSRPLLWRVVARGLMFTIFVVSIALVGWSLYQFYSTIPPLTRQIRQQDSERSALATEVQQLEMTWDAAAMEKLEGEYREARGQLIQGKEEQEKWLADLKRQAADLAFEADLRADAALVQPATNQNIVLVTAKLHLQPSLLGRGLTNSAYERLLALINRTPTPARRVDLVQLSITSDSNSIHRTQAHFNLWTQEKENVTP